jgi:steroid 5-alpha reductase family enzyme
MHHCTSRIALAMQVVGLLLETVADLQKSIFKSKYRHDWCNVGVWKYSTHPNYLGEALFWIGAHWNGLSDATIRTRGIPAAVAQVAASGIGMGFVLAVLRGAVLHARETQARKYGADPIFAAFQERYGVAGYRLWKNVLRPAIARHAGGVATPEAPAL